jgi:hypothetical protein
MFLLLSEGYKIMKNLINVYSSWMPDKGWGFALFNPQVVTKKVGYNYSNFHRKLNHATFGLKSTNHLFS